MVPSASIYTTLTLRLYDLIVLVFSNTFAWRCPTRPILLPFYQKHTSGSSAHLEVGPGTGFYPSTAVSIGGSLSKTVLITLCDLNPHTLTYSRHRLASAGYNGSVETLQHDIFQPLPVAHRGKYDSVALFYVLHCLPGSFPRKARAIFATVAPALAPDGVVFGCTILGRGVAHNWLGSGLMAVYNWKGIFGNAGDTEEGLMQALEGAFEEWEVRVVGVVALFEAKRPRIEQS